jgi:hypothetical protein
MLKGPNMLPQCLAAKDEVEVYAFEGSPNECCDGCAVCLQRLVSRYLRYRWSLRLVSRYLRYRRSLRLVSRYLRYHQSLMLVSRYLQYHQPDVDTLLSVGPM